MRSPICTRGLVTVEVDPRGLLPLTANSIGPSVGAALRYTKRRDKPQVTRAGLATVDHSRGGQAKYECGSRVWRRTVVVYITLRAYLPSASLSEKVLFVGHFKRGYHVWQVVHYRPIAQGSSGNTGTGECLHPGSLGAVASMV